MNPDDFLAELALERSVAILRTGDRDVAAQAMEAAVRGGFRILEFTLGIPGAFDLVRHFSRRPGLVVGVGTVLTVAEVAEAAGSGARFVVSPVVDPAVVQAAVERGLAAMPGTQTPTEMLTAYRAGAPLQKLFPAPGTGPAYVSACLAPLPFLRLVPTNGADRDNCAAYLRAGAFAVGFTSPLFDPQELAAGRFDRVEARARELRAAVSAA